MDKSKDNNVESWPVTSISKGTDDLLKAAGKVRDARTSLELLKKDAAKHQDDPDYLIADPAALDVIIEELAAMEGRICTQATNLMLAHRDNGDGLA